MLFEKQDYQEHCVGNILQALERLEEGAGQGVSKPAALKAAFETP